MCRAIVENLLSGTKAGFKATRNLVFNQKAERSTMNRQKSRAIVENVLSGTKAGFKATRNLVFNQKAERNTMNRQKSRAIVENLLSGTKAGFKSILNFEHAIERKKMDHQKSKSTFSAILLSFILGAFAFWMGPAVAAEKKMVTDPTTGKVVTAPEYGGTFTFANAAEQPHADAGLNAGAGVAVSGVIETLGIMNWAMDRDEFSFSNTYTPEFAFTGQLAESWDISPDGLTYTFHIRKGINWHDKAPMNGRELTAKDIEYNFHRMTGLGDFSGVGGNYTVMKTLPWESITATDKYTVVMKMKEPPPLNTLSAILGKQTWIYPPEVIKEHGDAKDWRNLVGTGPYEITDWVEGSSLTFTKNPNYWGHDEKYPENRLPYFDELQHLIITEEATRLAGLRSGQIDFLGFPAGPPDITSVDVLESLRKRNPEIVLIPWWDRSETSYGLDATKPPFDDIRVRRAMQMALDLEGIDRDFYKGTSRWQPQGMVGEGIIGYNNPFEEWPEEVQKGYMYDPKGAEALLDAAGYPRGTDGTRFKTVLNHLIFFDVGFAELAASYWAEIGVDVEIDVLDGATFGPFRVDTFAERTWEGMISTVLGHNCPPPPLWCAASHAHSKSIFNYHGIGYPELDALIDRAQATTSIEEQQRLIREVDMYTIENHYNVWGPLAGKFMAHQPWVIGYNGETLLSEQNRTPILARLWIDSELKKEMGH